ncbi:MAG: tetratricopeptide repeat protein [Candidatus Scalindua sp. AMX11]|nr:MAG: tetratricopeptide repeat protein [Candidatus Scalindua sp.]RZV88090.1 MAG: tetratricopeptide repeat protein [Candidatus Scalindua sp. SCAELEC01]TDE64023.1 MAG: tetratricopeptide repeat protein [Candidatus Scalindua sp. AMX11]
MHLFSRYSRTNFIFLFILYLFVGCSGKDATQLNKLGIHYLENGLYEKAITTLKQAIKDNPSHGEAHFHLGRAYKSLELEENAKAAFSLSFQIDPDKFHEYTIKFEEGAGYEPSDTQYLTELGSTYTEKAMYDEAITTFKKVVKIDPDHVRAHYNLGMIYSKMQMYHKAAEEFRTTIQLMPQMAEAHYNLGLVYQKRGMLDNAISEFKSTLDLFPEKVGRKEAGVHYKLGSVYYEIGKYDEAIEELQKALEISPNLAKAHEQLSTVYKSAGKIEEAKKELEIYHRLKNKR